MSFSLEVPSRGCTHTLNLEMMRRIMYHCAIAAARVKNLFLLFYLEVPVVALGIKPLDNEAGFLPLCYHW
jgi:hypothetical protein